MNDEQLIAIGKLLCREPTEFEHIFAKLVLLGAQPVTCVYEVDVYITYKNKIFIEGAWRSMESPQYYTDITWKDYFAFQTKYLPQDILDLVLQYSN